jgi:hypothetical protein
MAKNKVEQEILTAKIDLEGKLNEALSKLTVTSHHILTRRKTLLAQAEEAAANLAKAEADLRAASPISPIVPGKRVIVIIGAVSVGGLIIASNQSKGPAPPPPQAVSRPQPAPLPATTPVPPSRPTLPPHVEVGPAGQRIPEDGYDWADTGHTTVRWIQGKASRKTPHIVASDTEGKWQPEDGYDWVNPDRPEKTVRWTPGSPSSRYPNLVAATVEGQWRPAEGYAWVINPHRSDDMRVMPVSAWLDRVIAPSAPTALAPPGASAFDQGLADRAALENWVASLSGDLRRGADWWAARRSVLHPGPCNGTAATTPEFVAGCEAAKARLMPVDARRKSDPEYRRGWNTYTGIPIQPPAVAPVPLPSVPGPPVPLFGQPTQPAPPVSDDDQARRLNEQELKRQQGR